MLYEWILINSLLGLSISSIWAHQRMANLNLKASLIIGLKSALLADIALLCTYALKLPDMFSIILSIIVLCVSGFLIVIIKFFRDPERSSPADANVILSPADGTVIYIREVKQGEIPCPIKGKSYIKLNELAKTDYLKNGDGYLMGINMSLLDVHVNRAPISGEVVFLKHTKGELISLKSWVSEIKNERNTIFFKNDLVTIGIVQIASKLVARIIPYVKQSDSIKMGDRIGRITLGSQVDVMLPSSIEISVMEGEQVRAGETIIGRIRSGNE